MRNIKNKLKKELGLLGSFSMGFADVGADIFLALGLIAAYAHGVMPLALLAAAIVYICSGLSYAELSAAMPVSGGSSHFGRMAFGNKTSFLAGWGLMLDYTICIALFAVASAGYLSYFIPGVREVFSLVSVFLIFILMFVNLLGIRESSLVNSFLTVVAIIIIIALLLVGFGTTFSFEKFVSGIKPIDVDPGIENFLYSITIAMVAFVGIESISQGAEETKDPGKTLPKATFLSIFFVVFFALVLSTMVLGIVTPQTLADNMDNPLIPVTKMFPFSEIITPIIAFAGFIICFVSANTGIIGASRVVYSMSQAGLVSRRISWIHPIYRTPWWTVVIFSLIAMVLAFFGDMVFLGELYAFGALTAYTVTNLSLIQLRFKEPKMERPFKVPLNIKIKGRDVPIITIIGSIGCISIFMLVALLHEEGRNFAFVWFVAGFIYYYLYRRYRAKIDARTYIPIQHRLN